MITLITVHHVDIWSTIPTKMTVLRVRHVQCWDLKWVKQAAVSLCPYYIHISLCTVPHACDNLDDNWLNMWATLIIIATIVSTPLHTYPVMMAASKCLPFQAAHVIFFNDWPLLLPCEEDAWCLKPHWIAYLQNKAVVSIAIFMLTLGKMIDLVVHR